MLSSTFVDDIGYLLRVRRENALSLKALVDETIREFGQTKGATGAEKTRIENEIQSAQTRSLIAPDG